jgi:membrane fusion protein, multidrug efflux system
MDERVTKTETRTYEPVTRVTTRRRRTRVRILWAGIIGIIVIALIVWHPWSNPSGGKHGYNPANAPQAVGVATAATGDMPVTQTALGTVTPLATVTVQTQINGQLTDVGFREGQIVQKGDFLAQIDPRPYEAALGQAQGTLAKDQALLSEAKIDLTRYQTLWKQDSIARQQVDTQVSLVHQYEGQVITDQAAVDTQKLNLVYCHITAPVSGRVGLRQVDPGNYVQTTSATGIVVITQLAPISVIFSIPEDALSQVLPRMKAGAQLAVTALDRNDSHKIAEGTVSTIDNVIDTTTGTVKVRAVFDNKDDALFPNQFVNASLLIDTMHEVVLVPNAAILRSAPGTFVYLVKHDESGDTVAVQKVTIGPNNGTMTAVTEGLKAGDVVVTDGTDRLKDGAKIRIPNQEQQAGSEPATQPGAAGATPGSGTPGSTAEETPTQGTPPGGTQGQHWHHRQSSGQQGQPSQSSQ